LQEPCSVTTFMAGSRLRAAYDRRAGNVRSYRSCNEQGTVRNYQEHYSKWLLYSVLILLLGANTINIYADINVMASSMKMLFGLPFRVWATLLTIGMVVAQVTIPYKHYVKFLKYACMSLLSYVVIAVLPKVHVNWYSVVHHLVIPHLSLKPEYVLTVVGFLARPSRLIFSSGRPGNRSRTI